MWLVIFGSGCVVGAGAMLIAVRSGVLWAIHHPEEMPPRVAARLRSKLRLEEDQTRQVESILGARQTHLQDIRRRTQPTVEAELDELAEQVSAVLNDSQRAQWQQTFQSLRGTWLPAPPP